MRTRGEGGTPPPPSPSFVQGGDHPPPHVPEQVGGIPSLVKQHRIVAKVDTLMALCDALRLKARAAVQ